MSIEHASSVLLDDRALLIFGPSGSGKSDLALRLVEAGGQLIADDRTVLIPRGGALWAEAPTRLAGLIEVRGLGLVRLPAAQVAASGRVAGVVELVADRAALDRLPEARVRQVSGRDLPALRLYPFEASAVIKTRLFLTAGMAGRE